MMLSPAFSMLPRAFVYSVPGSRSPVRLVVPKREERDFPTIAEAIDKATEEGFRPVVVSL
jgi:hypothetical protein